MLSCQLDEKRWVHSTKQVFKCPIITTVLLFCEDSCVKDAVYISFNAQNRRHLTSDVMSMSLLLQLNVKHNDPDTGVFWLVFRVSECFRFYCMNLIDSLMNGISWINLKSWAQISPYVEWNRDCTHGAKAVIVVDASAWEPVYKFFVSCLILWPSGR